MDSDACKGTDFDSTHMHKSCYQTRVISLKNRLWRFLMWPLRIQIRWHAEWMRGMLSKNRRWRFLVERRGNQCRLQLWTHVNSLKNSRWRFLPLNRSNQSVSVGNLQVWPKNCQWHFFGWESLQHHVPLFHLCVINHRIYKGEVKGRVVWNRREKERKKKRLCECEWSVEKKKSFCLYKRQRKI